MAIAVAAAASVGACSDSPAPETRGDVVVRVETDAPVDALRLRLRVDVFGEDGHWVESKEAAAGAERIWPATFRLSSVTSKRVTLRLRAFPDGATRPYEGERFVPRPSPGSPTARIVIPPASGQPRLVTAERDETPEREPLPELAIDRLVMVEVAAGRGGEARAILSLACVGQQANLEEHTSCQGEQGEVGPAPLLTIAASSEISGNVPPPTSRAASSAECGVAPRRPHQGEDGTPLHDEEVCVPAATIVLGDSRGAIDVAVDAPGANGAVVDDAIREFPAVPARVVQMPALLVDRYEVTVGRYRAAVAAGFRSADTSPLANEGPLDFTSANPSARRTFSQKVMGREELPINSVSFATARAFCKFQGGDLPTEAQWEHAARHGTAAFGPTYPWGDEAPSCDGTVFARYRLGNTAGKCVAHEQWTPGPAKVTDGARDETPLGIHGLGGNVSEWVLDYAHPFDARCWWNAASDDPRCETPSKHRSVRGGSFSTDTLTTRTFSRIGVLANAVFDSLGFRCVRSGAGASSER